MLNWLTMRWVGVRRWAVDILMITFLLSAVVGAIVLAYFAVR